MRLTCNDSRGFTLIELILYVALVSIFISGAVLFAWDVIYGRVKSQVQREVGSNGRLAARRVEFEVRNASAINSVSSSEICLASSVSERNPTRIYLDNQRLRVSWGGGSSDCTSMTNDEALTSSEVTVSGLSFTDLSSGSESLNVSYSFSVSTTADREEWQESGDFQGAVELRSN